uniref:IncF plasmid conjugative transfer protein TraN n=1 Tax=Klebsiella pneumoniae TaxID=573 RepID=A0A8B0SWA2_KLEPN|nr:IncF plasmid conjugative transfer protein TraN [Klebsiella pneumoniae]
MPKTDGSDIAGTVMLPNMNGNNINIKRFRKRWKVTFT